MDISPLLNNAVGEPNIIIALEVLYCKLKQLQPPAGGLFVFQSSVFRINEKLHNVKQGFALTIKQSLRDNHIFDCLSSSVYLLVLQIIHYYSAFDFANIAISPTPFKTIVGRYA